MKKELLIFSNTRQIKEYIKTLNNGFFPTLISIQDFFKDFTLYDGLRANNVQRILALNKAVLKTKNYSKLQLSEDFMSFLQNKEYLFSFFAELNSEQVSIEKLRQCDIYSFFTEYLDILEECLTHYKDELEQNNLYDEIIIKEYKPNLFLLNQYKKITFFQNGFLKKYEVKFFEHISSFIDLEIIINTSKYNKSLIEKSFLIKVETDKKYKLVFNKTWQATIIDEIKSNNILNTASFKNELNEYIYALHLISKFIKEGANAQDIVVVMPNENASKSLKSLDIKNYLNIASGIANNEIAQKINSLIGQNTYELSKESIQKQLLNCKNIVLEDDFEKLKNQIIDLVKNEEIKQILSERLQEIEILNKEFSLSKSEIIKLLKLDDIQISHNDGGEVSAIGLLESRGIKYKYVIILDFNDDLVPNRSINEMFLNNKLRKHAGLISYEDRENLQRHYYKELFDSENVYILYVSNEEKSPARMLKEYRLNKIEVNEDMLLNSYLKQYKSNIMCNEELLSINEELLEKYDICKDELSFSKISTYLNSGYEYYLKYILKLKEPRSLIGLEAKDIGILVHKILQNANLNSLDDFKKDFLVLKNQIPIIDYVLIQSNLNKIFSVLKECEIKYGLAKTEEEVKKNIGGFKLIGIIDRHYSNVLIDYKISKNPSSTKKHFNQLGFYAMLLEGDLKAIVMYLKSIKNPVVIQETLEKEINANLEILEDLKTNFNILNNPENAYGYYYLIINKRLKK